MTDDPRVQQLLDELLASHATPEVVCASCPELLPLVSNRWRQMRRLRADLDALFPSPDEPTPRPPEGTTLPEIPGYEFEAILGRGGMGVVFKARHLKLKRLVAVKMLLAGAHAGSEELARFRREAEAVAALRHPNIVQIHDAGEITGRPYFTMEFVEGGSLAPILPGQRQPPRHAAELVATLAAAVQFAHKSGFLHRDLKPGNVLLTAEGTPKITDFGLARSLHERPELTRTGIPLGTPSYMAPEQAQGKLSEIGPAVDVYALGAVLYEMLTGRPPFVGQSAVETELKVISEEPTPPSRLNAQVPRDLETICLKCLQKKPARRYASAQDLADDLHRYLDGKPVLARPVGVVERMRKWVRRRPAAAGLLAATALLAAAAGVVGWTLYQQQAAAEMRQIQTDQEVRSVLAAARGRLEQAWKAADLAKLTEAAAEGSRAEDIARSGGASSAVWHEVKAFQKAVSARLERAQKNRALTEAVLDVSDLQETREYLPDAESRLVGLARLSVDEQYAAAFRRWGLDVDGTPEAEVVKRLGAEPEVVVQELIAALDNWMLERQQLRPEGQWRRLHRVAEQLDRSDHRRRLRALLVGESPPRPESLAGLVGVGSPWPALWAQARGSDWRQLLEIRREIQPRAEPVLTVVLLARAFNTVGDATGAEDLLRQAVTARPDEVVLLNALGTQLAQRGPSKLEEAIGYYRAARVKRPDLGIALCSALVLAGRPGQAEDVMRELVYHQADNPLFHFYLGLVLNQQNKYGAAEAAFRQAIASKLDLAEAHLNLGNTLLNQQKYAAAEAAYHQALARKPDYADAHSNLGCVLLLQQKYAAAEAACREALARKPDLAEAHYNLGNALVNQGEFGAAEAAFRQALACNPIDAKAYVNLVGTLIGQQKYEEAQTVYREALARKLDRAEIHYNLGNVWFGQMKYAAAEAAYRQALARNPGFAEAHARLGDALLAQQKYGAAAAAFREAIAHKLDRAEVHYKLGITLTAQGKHVGAEAAYRLAIARKPDYTEAHVNLGGALLLQQKYSAAEAALRKALDLKPDFALAWYHLGFALMEQAQFDEAATSLKKAGDLFPGKHPGIEQARQLGEQCQRFRILDFRLPSILSGTVKPANAAEYLEFARLCKLKRLYASAAGLYAGAFAMKLQGTDEPRTGHRFQAACSAALASWGRWEEPGKPGVSERARWRRQAQEWLRADLNSLARWLDRDFAAGRGFVRKALTHWQENPELTSVRDPAELDKLTGDERRELVALWVEVAAVLARTE
jgi:serine/threonine-protein kinase